MNISGALILFVGIGLLIYVGVSATGGNYDVINDSMNDSSQMYDTFQKSKNVVSPMLRFLGYGALILGVFLTIKAFSGNR